MVTRSVGLRGAGRARRRLVLRATASDVMGLGSKTRSAFFTPTLPTARAHSHKPRCDVGLNKTLMLLIIPYVETTNTDVTSALREWTTVVGCANDKGWPQAQAWDRHENTASCDIVANAGVCVCCVPG